ncbi:MAG: hypothetical protein ACM3TN_24830 [Alphaproteobacteria bacterium]
MSDRGLNLFTIEPERSGLVVTWATNDHIEQHNAVFFAKHSIHSACGDPITVAAKKLHDMVVVQLACQWTVAD